MNSTFLCERARVLILIGVVSCAASSCLARRTVIRERRAPPPPPGSVETEEIYVEQEPPAPHVEVITVAPSPEHIWVAGHWHWNHAWVWVPGVWMHKPHAHAVWVSGGWNRRGHGWVLVGGRWRAQYSEPFALSVSPARSGA